MGQEGLLREDWGQYADAIRWYNRGLKAADALADPTARLRHRLDLGLGYAQTRYRQGRFGECTERCREVVAEALPVGDTKTLAPAYLLLHLVHTMLGSPERAAYRGLALPLYEELGDLSGQASVLNNTGIEAYYAGDWTRAVELYEQSRDLRERIGDVVSVAIANNNVAEILSDQGRLDEARALFTQAVATGEQVGHATLVALGRANIGYAEARAGELEGAASSLVQAAASFDELDMSSFALETKVHLAEVAALRDDAADALALADDALAHTGDAAGMLALQSNAHRVRAAALHQLGDADAAGAALDQAVAAARSGEADFQLALALDLLALVDDDRDAASESVEILRRLDVARIARPPLEPR